MELLSKDLFELKRDLSKLKTVEKNAVNAGLVVLEKHVLPIADIFNQLDAQRRQKLLEHSPILARFVELARGFSDDSDS